MTTLVSPGLKISGNYSFDEYFLLVNELSETNSTTGNETSPERLQATKLNAQRMKRITRQFTVSEEVKQILKTLNEKWQWIILSESWCGDGAQCIPVLSKIASVSQNIELKIILRDENPELMNAHLTNGAKAIPKLICINPLTKHEIGTWGPRPAAIQKMVTDFKAHNPEVPHEEFLKNLHLWYAQDKGKSLESEFSALLKQWMGK